MDHVTVVPIIIPHPLGDQEWHFAAEIESEIITLAAVCHMKQQQREPLKQHTENDQRDGLGSTRSDDDDDDVSIRLATLTTDETKGIKMRFLDHIAQILCAHKHASYVTCTSIVEHCDNITVVAARNAGWTAPDLQIMSEVATVMEQVASRTFETDEVLALCEKLANYYVPRLRYHVRCLLDQLKKTSLVFSLVDTCLDFQSGEISPIGLVKYVQSVVENSHLVTQIRTSVNPDRYKRILNEMHCICRPHFTCDALYDAARHVAGFQKVKIQLLVGFDSRAVAKSISCLSTFPNDTKLQTRLNEQMKKRKWVHSEMRMIAFLFSHDLASRAFPYLGISKKTCFLCGHIIQKLGMFSTRGNHGKVYSQWTLPSRVILPNKYMEIWQLAIRHLQEVLQSEATRNDLPLMWAVKESTITTPAVPRLQKANIFMSHVPDPRLQERETTWLGFFSKRESVSQYVFYLNSKYATTTYFCRDQDIADCSQLSIDSVSSEIQVHESTAAQTTPKSKPKICCYCKEQSKTLADCSRCMSVAYCGSKCRTSHWLEHKFRCRLGRSIDAADYLVWFCHRKEYPSDDEDVGTTFGFRHFISAVDRQILFALYCKLVNIGGVGDDELREACRNDKLRDFILFRGAQLPRVVIGEELEWFQTHDHFAANSIADFSKIMDSAKDVLSSVEEDTWLDALDSEVKQHAYLFYCQIRNGYVPSADEDNWMDLGFCTAQRQEDFHQIANLYQALVSRCNFDEFWQAMDESAMVELFHKYALGSEIEKMHNFKILLDSVGKWHQSVWELKRFTLLPDREPLRAVVVDYGFMNCQDTRERIKLRSVYTKFFSMGLDEMNLHQACVEGQLARFLEVDLGELPFPGQLLSNPYPLEGCTHMGIVAKKVVGCSESDYELMRDKLRAEGDNSMLCTIPDDYDNDMEAHVRQRAGYLTGVVNVTTTEFAGKIIKSISSE